MKRINTNILLLIFCYLITFLLICSGCTNSNNAEDGTYGDNGEYKEDSKKPDCGIEDGSHSATVDYYNPETGYNASYTLDVQVNDCEVTEIDFPKGGWLDDSHISPTELDEDGNASIEDDRGRTFEVHVDN